MKKTIHDFNMSILIYWFNTRGIVYKSLIFLLVDILVIPNLIFAQQRYFVLDQKSSQYKSSHIKLSSRAIYDVDCEIELFNILIDKVDGNQDLILFSVLPEFDRNEAWREINIDSITSKIFPFYKLKDLCADATLSKFTANYDDKTKFFNEYKLVIKKDNKYYQAINTLLQFYAIRNRNEFFNNIYGTINIRREPLSITQMEAIYKKQYPGTEFPLYTLRNPVYSSRFDRLRDRAEYLSKIFENAKGEKCYQFWTFTDWHEHKAFYEVDRGIDRFIYIPDVGIVGGSFDFYFYFHRKKLDINTKTFIDNIIAERVMTGI